MKTYRNYIAAALAVILSAGVTGTFAYANNTPAAEESAAVAEEAASLPAPADLRNDASAEKDETVYVLAGADGSVQKIIVSDWLRNNSGAKELGDFSTLSGITNVKSDAGYSVKSDGALVWDAQGDDLYYQGTGTAELPVGLQVSYLLDGKPISAEELAGKSGRVTIRYSYENHCSRTVKINGKDETIYVPFAMLTGVILDQSHFSNIAITNGKLISDGNRTVAAGFALPGMQETLGIDKDQLEIPDSFEITADVQDFELGMTVTLAVNDLFSGIGTDKLDSMDDLDDAVKEMNDAMSKLTDGSSQLYDGLSTLLDKSGELVKGIRDLADGAKRLRDGTVTLADGAKTLQNGTSQLSGGAGDLKNGTAELSSGAAALQDGASELSAGLETLTANNDALNGGAKQVFETLLSTANSQIAAAGLDTPELTIENYADTLNQVIGSLDGEKVYEMALAQVTQAVEAKRPLITEKVTAAVREQVAAKVAEQVEQQVQAAVTAQVQANADLIRAAVIEQAANMTAEQYDAAAAAGLIPAQQQAQIEAAIEKTIQSKIEEQLTSDEVKQKIDALTTENTDAQMQTAEVQTLIAQNTEAQVQKAIADNMAGDEVQAKLKSASAGAQSLMNLKTQLDSYNAFYMGLQQYTAGVSAAAAGADALKNGVDTLKAGTSKLDSGADALRSGASQVNSGAGALQSGANSLQSGASALYDGILKLQDGVPALTDGITQLKDGAMQLTDGIKAFDEQGIQKISEAVEGDLDGLVQRFKAAVDAARTYNSYSGVDSKMNGKVKFIYRTDEIGK